jgi:hypothetical protein
MDPGLGAVINGVKDTLLNASTDGAKLSTHVAVLADVSQMLDDVDRGVKLNATGQFIKLDAANHGAKPAYLFYKYPTK